MQCIHGRDNVACLGRQSVPCLHILHECILYPGMYIESRVTSLIVWQFESLGVFGAKTFTKLVSWRYISQLVRFARCCTSVFDFHSKNLQITSKLLTQGYRYHKLRKTFGKFFRSYSELCPNLVLYRFRIMYHKESLTLSSTVILCTNFGGSKAKRIPSRRARNAFDVVSMTQRSSRGL